MRAYSHLSEQERDQIAAQRAAGWSLGAIERQLGRAKATISREVRRNALQSGRYSPQHAAGAYIWRRWRAALIEKDARLQTFVVDRLAKSWSPEQIADWLKSGAERCLRAIGCETIYAFIYRAGQKGAELWRYLARRRKRRRPLRIRPARNLIKDRASIHERPTIVDAREEVGHWEADLVI